MDGQRAEEAAQQEQRGWQRDERQNSRAEISLGEIRDAYLSSTNLSQLLSVPHTQKEVSPSFKFPDTFTNTLKFLMRHRKIYRPKCQKSDIELH